MGGSSNPFKSITKEVSRAASSASGAVSTAFDQTKAETSRVTDSVSGAVSTAFDQTKAEASRAAKKLEEETKRVAEQAAAEASRVAKKVEEEARRVRDQIAAEARRAAASLARKRAADNKAAMDLARQSQRDTESRYTWQKDRNLADAKALKEREIAKQEAIKKEFKSEFERYDAKSQSLFDASRTNYNVDRELNSRSGMDVFKGDNLFKGGTTKNYNNNISTKASDNDNKESSFSDWYDATKKKDPSLFDIESRKYKTDPIENIAEYETSTIAGGSYSNAAQQTAFYNKRNAALEDRVKRSGDYYASVKSEYEAKTKEEKTNLGTYDKLTKDWEEVAKGYKKDTEGVVGKNMSFARRGGLSDVTKDITKERKDTAIAKKAGNLGFAKSKRLGSEDVSDTLG